VFGSSDRNPDRNVHFVLSIWLPCPHSNTSTGLLVRRPADDGYLTLFCPVLTVFHSAPASACLLLINEER
jgi:hypothetical protein